MSIVRYKYSKEGVTMNHLAIIADGNRRWAKQHNLSQEHGYWQGLKTIEHISEWAINNNIKYLTFYCLSTENWKREEKEIKMLF
jgi:undecaprenyl diphosphate synthase